MRTEYLSTPIFQPVFTNKSFAVLPLFCVSRRCKQFSVTNMAFDPKKRKREEESIKIPDNDNLEFNFGESIDYNMNSWDPFPGGSELGSPSMDDMNGFEVLTPDGSDFSSREDWSEGSPIGSPFNFIGGGLDLNLDSVHPFPPFGSTSDPGSSVLRGDGSIVGNGNDAMEVSSIESFSNIPVSHTMMTDAEVQVKKEPGMVHVKMESGTVKVKKEPGKGHRRKYDAMNTEISVESGVKVEATSPEIEAAKVALGKLLDDVRMGESKISSMLRQVPLPLSDQVSAELRAHIHAYHTKAVSGSAGCFELKSKQLLGINELHWLLRAEADFMCFTKQLEIYENEIEQLLKNPRDIIHVACMVIVSQPFPMAVKQGQSVPSIEVKLITGCRSSYEVVGRVAAVPLEDWATSSNTSGTGKKNSNPMKNHEAEVINNFTSFNKLAFTMGTGLTIKQINFQVLVRSTPIQGGIAFKELLVKSNISKSFVVITNTKQWIEAEGRLLKAELLGKNVEKISRMLFANTVQLHYLRATKQNFICPSRPLSKGDFTFLFRDIMGLRRGGVVTETQFTKFWDWFGPTLQKIKYQHFISRFWKDGLIWGLLTKVDANNELSKDGCIVGTFILRFSCRSPGSLAVAYKRSPTEVKHYLPSSAGNLYNKKPLPDFVREQGSFVYFLKLVINADLQRTITHIDKHDVLDNIGRKTSRRGPSERDASYYDEEVEDLEMDMNVMSLR